MRLAILTLAAVLLGTPAYAMGMTDPPVGQTRPYATSVRIQNVAREETYTRIQSELLALRQEGLRLRAGDGGTLSDEHRVYLQGKFDAILAEQKRAQ